MAGFGDHVLGLDLDVSSLDWAVVDLDPVRRYRPFRICDAGVRCRKERRCDFAHAARTRLQSAVHLDSCTHVRRD